VVAFEPNPRNIGYLKRHMELNKVTNIEIVEAAVSSSEGQVGFEAPRDSSMGHVRDGAAIRVPSVSLDAWVAAHDVHPTVIKIDVEGHEPPVLQGATNILSPIRPAIVLSVGPQSLNDCRAVLDSHGYRMDPIGSPDDSTEFACYPLPDIGRSD
jgi:FkbM family methyltransferase